MGHHRRREPQRERQRAVPRRRRNSVAQRAAAGARRRREHLSPPRKSRLHRPRRVRRLHPESLTRHRIRVPIPALRPRRCNRPDDARRPGHYAHRTHAVQRRAHASRLPAGPQGRENRAQLHQRAPGVLRRGPRRLERRVGAPRPTRRHHPRPRRPLQAGAVQLRRSDDGAVRRLDVADAQRHERQAHHHQGGRRRRSHLRRRWQRAIVRRHGVEPSHLRRTHVSQHRRRHLRRPERSAGRRRPCGEELPLRKRRHGRLDRIRRARAISTSPTTCSSAATIASASWAGPVRCGRAPVLTARICSRAITP